MRSVVYLITARMLAVLPTFRMYMMPPSSGSKSEIQCCYHRAYRYHHTYLYRETSSATADKLPPLLLR
jgi:hypothetical protein